MSHQPYSNSLLIDADSNNNIYAANNVFIGNIAGRVQQNAFYNLSTTQNLPGEGNIQVSDLSTVFVDPDNGDYHLLSDSPARGAGRGNVDMGIYGGDIPFVDGGRPGLPLITEINSDFVGTQDGGLDVTIKAKSVAE